jgi:hypothetical protein
MRIDPHVLLLRPSARVPKSQGLRCVLHVFLDVAELCLDLAQILLDLPFRFHALVADELASDFLDLALRFLDTAFDLVLVDAHELLPLMYAGKRPARFLPRVEQMQWSMWTSPAALSVRCRTVSLRAGVPPRCRRTQEGFVCASEQTLIATVDIVVS